MSITKNPLIRYKVLDQCFRNPGKRYFIDDLISECNKVMSELDPSYRGISRRQLLDDISFMESSEGWSVVLVRHRVGRKVFYRYADIKYSINNMPLNAVELNQLRSALSVLNQFKGIPQFDGLDTLLAKIQHSPSGGTKNLKAAFDHNPFLKGNEHLGTLFNALHHRIPLKITYQDFKAAESYQVLLHPYHLKQYNNRWFLFGYNPERAKKDWNMAVDRIIAVEEFDSAFIESDIEDWEEYFEDIVGVTKPEGAEVELIRIEIYGDTAKYIMNKPIHGSQKSKRLMDRPGIEVSLQLIINYEIKQLILSYADSMKVVSPPHFVDSIKRHFNNAVALYL
ncbi:helix-turn-helix transcriptional regulator [Pararcticibacter amylolyticus]|uniref:WYL domain-containing protein n=1 Tax=Pararcticibacter amylolyticus TaxID=2173175 RepID=A0A2U2P9J7_9SPHI|nr:WYL domain-containing protein [Pararcticibacter amylolyticus]PWG78057.1 WYL domain-containing protein [Pararcticibacter amylolyticus]